MRFRATIRMLRKLTRQHAVDADAMRALLAAGVSGKQIEDALAVCFVLKRGRSAIAHLRVGRCHSPRLCSCVPRSERTDDDVGRFEWIGQDRRPTLGEVFQELMDCY
jgi:hypothetical protein